MNVPTRVVAFRGPGGIILRETLLDSGAAKAILTENDADQIGVRPSAYETVNTDGGKVSWGSGSVEVSLNGTDWHSEPIWISPEQDGAPPTLGWQALQSVGYRLQPPSYASVAVNMGSE